MGQTFLPGNRAMQQQYDLRESDTHRALLETPGTLAYLPHALRWSFRFEVIAVAVLFGGILGIFGPSWLGIFFFALFGSAALTWLLTVQARAILGFGDPPRLDYELIQQAGSIVPRLLIFGAIVLIAYAALEGLPGPWQRTFAWLAGAMLPVVFATLAIEESIMPALHPLRALRVFIASGPLGWVLTILSALGVEAGLRNLQAMLGTFDIEWLSGLVSNFAPSLNVVGGSIIGVWVLALLFHMYGHALHHRHDLAGFNVYLAALDDDARADKRRAGVVERMADALEDAHRRGDRTAAEQLAAAAPPDDVDKLAYYADLWERLHLERKYAVALLVAKRLLPVAVERKRNKLAHDILLEAWKLSPGFEPGPGVRRALARYLQALGDHAGFDRVSDIDPAAWPDDPDAVALAELRSYWLEEQDPR